MNLKPHSTMNLTRIPSLTALVALSLAAWLPLLPSLHAQAPAPKLLPFQGRLTAADGTAVTNGARVVQFKLYDAAVAGRTVWVGEVHKLTVNQGLVSTLLGSRSRLAEVDFDRELFLEITVDANGDGEIGLEDPPLLPRQSVLPSVFAKESADARLLGGYSWTDLFAEGATNPPLARIAGGRLVAGSVSSNQLAVRTITSDRLQLGAVTGDEIKERSVDRRHLTADVLESVLPAGVIVPFAGSTNGIPRGWLLCDGRAMASTNYPVLFAAIGTSWGNGTVNERGTTIDQQLIDANKYDFNLPDLRGTFLRGVAHGSPRDPDAEGRTAGKAGGNTGNEVGSLQADEFKTHQHPVTLRHFLANPNDPPLLPPNMLPMPLTAHHPLTTTNIPPAVIPADFQSGFAQGGAFSFPGGPQGAGISRTVLGTADSGGKETRPVNAAVNYIIKH